MFQVMVTLEDFTVCWVSAFENNGHNGYRCHPHRRFACSFMHRAAALRGFNSAMTELLPTSIDGAEFMRCELVPVSK